LGAGREAGLAAERRRPSGRSQSPIGCLAAERRTTLLRMSNHPLHPTHPGSKRHVERLRALCLELPEVAEKLAWGTPTWRVGGRVFAQLADHHHGNPHLAVWLAAPDGAQQALIEAEPARFFRPAYVGHLGWVAAILDEDADWAMMAAVVRQAHRVTARKLPQRKAAEILAAAEAMDEPAEKRPAEKRPAEKKPAEKKPAEKKVPAKKKAEKKALAKRPAEKKALAKRPAEKKVPAKKKAAPATPAKKPTARRRA
jgi:hypothetical protein